MRYFRAINKKRTEMNIKTKYVGIILFICIGLRLIFFGFVQPWTPEVETQVILQFDAHLYHQLASTLIESHRFAYSSTGPPEALRTPLYPLLIAGFYLLFGHKPWIVLLVQILIDTLSCFLLLLTLSRLFDQRVALISSLFYALDPFLISHSSKLLSDVLFIFLLVAAFYLFSVAITAKSHRTALLSYGISSLFMGIATLVRPISQYIPLILVVFFFIYYRRLKDIIKYSILCLFVFVLMLSPWFIRNYNTFGSFSLSTSGPYNLLVLNVVPMEMARRKQDALTVRCDLLGEAEKMIIADGKEPQKLNQFQRAEYWQRLAIKYITSDPFRFGQFYFLGIFHSFASLGTSTYAHMLRLPMTTSNMKGYANIFDLVKAFFREKGTTGLVIAGIIAPYLLISYLGLVVGLFISWKQYNKGPLLFCLLLALYFIAIPGAGGHARFKLPSLPFYIPFVGIGINYFYERVRYGRKP